MWYEHSKYQYKHANISYVQLLTTVCWYSSGLLYDWTGDYKAPFLTSGTCLTAAAILLTITRLLPNKGSNSTIQETMKMVHTDYLEEWKKACFGFAATAGRIVPLQTSIVLFCKRFKHINRSTFRNLHTLLLMSIYICVVKGIRCAELIYAYFTIVFQFIYKLLFCLCNMYL